MHLSSGGRPAVVSAALLFPPGALPAGFTITVQGARIDNVSGLLVFGTSVDVVTVP